MPSLLSLSNGLLLHIASYFKYHGDINSFMQITGRLYYLLRNKLYRLNIEQHGSSMLEWAVEHGMELTVQMLLKRGAMSQTRKDTLWYIFVKALKNKHDGVVKLLLENGIEAFISRTPQEWTYPACLDKKGRINDTLLYEGLSSGFESTLRVLLAHEMKEGPTKRAVDRGDLTIEGFFTKHLPLIVNCESSGCSRPLIDAVRKGGTETVRFLLSVGANPNVTSTYYDTALQMARRDRNIEAFRLLLENGVCLENAWKEWCLEFRSFPSTQNEKKWDVEGMLLLAAATCGCTPVVQQILEKGSHEDNRPWGSRVFLLSSRKPPPLNIAVEWGYMDIIALMLDYGADPAPDMEYGPRASPFHTAISQDRVDIVKMMMDRGVGIDVHRGNTRDLLDVDVLGHVIRSPSMLQLFLDRGILDLECPSTTANLMASAMDVANAALLQILHDKGITLKLSARRGKFRKIHTLEAAIREGNQTVVKFLFSKGLSPKQGKYLEQAAYAEDPETASAMVDLLLRHGTDMDKMDDTCPFASCTGKYCVCNHSEDQQMKVVRLFLDKGISPLPESNKWARIILLRAANKGHTKVVRLLLQAINDTHGVSLDDVQRNLDYLEAHWHFRGAMKKFLEDCYWRKKYPVP